MQSLSRGRLELLYDFRDDELEIDARHGLLLLLRPEDRVRPDAREGTAEDEGDEQADEGAGRADDAVHGCARPVRLALAEKEAGGLSEHSPHERQGPRVMPVALGAAQGSRPRCRGFLLIRSSRRRRAS